MANVIIRISDGQRQIYDYRQELWQSGFVFNKRSNGKQTRRLVNSGSYMQRRINYPVF